MKDRPEQPHLELDAYVPVRMPEEFVVWATGYLSALSDNPIREVDIYEMFRAVSVAMMAGTGFAGTREESYEFAYGAYCGALEFLCELRGYAQHPHRHLRPANDD